MISTSKLNQTVKNTSSHLYRKSIGILSKGIILLSLTITIYFRGVLFSSIFAGFSLNFCGFSFSTKFLWDFYSNLTRHVTYMALTAGPAISLKSEINKISLRQKKYPNTENISKINKTNT